MTQDDRAKWNSRYDSDPLWQRDRRPFPWLTSHAPPSAGGVALDLACGLGQNAIYLARQGYRVIGVDGSMVGLRRGQAAAREEGLADRIVFVQADLDSFRPAAECCDLICVIRFLSRDLFPWLVSALRPGGLLIYATLNWGWAETHPEANPEFLLQPGELPAAFPDLSLIDHQENAEMSYFVSFKAASR